MNTPICTGVTVLTLYFVEVMILELGKGLWFGNRMEKFLINPNKCQNVGIQICDDPTDLHRKLDIETCKYLFIPMSTDGSTCGLVTRPPNYEKLHECNHTSLSDEFEWYPPNNLFEISPLEDST